MAPALTKIVYQPDHTSTDVYTIFIHPEELAKYQEDKSVPLIQVVDSFDIFYSNSGATGTLGKASKQQLDTAFGTSKDEEVLKQIIEKGEVQSGKRLSAHGYADKNDSRGGR